MRGGTDCGRHVQDVSKLWLDKLSRGELIPSGDGTIRLCSLISFLVRKREETAIVCLDP